MRVASCVGDAWGGAADVLRGDMGREEHGVTTSHTRICFWVCAQTLRESSLVFVFDRHTRDVSSPDSPLAELRACLDLFCACLIRGASSTISSALDLMNLPLCSAQILSASTALSDSALYAKSRQRRHVHLRRRRIYRVNTTHLSPLRSIRSPQHSSPSTT